MTISRRFLFTAVVFAAAAPGLAACDEVGQANGSDHRYAGIETDSENGEHPPPADLVGRTRCDATEAGRARATGGVLNRTSERSEYDIGVEFTAPDGRSATGHAHVSELRPGRPMEWVVIVDLESPAVTCEVVEVQRYAS
jgi:hypothetical protein